MLLSKMRSTRWVRASGSGSGPLHHTHPHPSFVRYTRSFDAYEIRGFTSTIFTWGRAPDSLLGLRSLNTESEHSLARAWLEEFGVGDIPKEAWSAGYTRSSGPGGQVSPCPLSSLHSHPLSLLVLGNLTWLSSGDKILCLRGTAQGATGGMSFFIPQHG